MSDPDYNNYLQAIYPETEWSVSRFSHGSINATYRAVKTTGDAGPPSIVLKHAYPYFEDEESGHVQRFSLTRQEIESVVMAFWAQDTPLQGSSHLYWRVPRPLHRSQGMESKLLHTQELEDISILLVEDLGNVRNLRDTILAWAELGTKDRVSEAVSQIGHTLGLSLATLHGPNTIQALESSGLQDIVSQRLTDDVVWFLSMELLPDYLAGAARASEYFEWLVEDVKSPKHTYPPCLMHGDFNYGNIMLQTDALETGNTQPMVIDWEFATSQGRGVNGDVSEFLSMIHCRVISGRNQQTPSATYFRLLCTSFCSAYRDKAQLVCTMQVDDLNTQLYRSALLLSGRDILTFANDACRDDPVFDEMVDVGLWYFERAGASMEEFVQQSNVVQLAKEDEGFVHSLFIFNSEGV